MIILDLIGALIPFIFLVASHYKSIGMIYVVTFIQASIAALYDPCRSSILPLMVTQDEALKLATTLTELAWSGVAAVASGLGGYSISIIGINGCFVVDSISFVISAFVMFLVGGKWNVSERSHENLTFCETIKDMTISGFDYIMSTSFWPLVFIKMSSSFVYGGGDILNVSFSEEKDDSNTEEQSRKLGAILFVVGVGCFLGPLVADVFTNMNQLKSVLDACVAAFALQAVGFLCMGFFSPFSLTLTGSAMRAAGSSLSWVNSQILLQVKLIVLNMKSIFPTLKQTFPYTTYSQQQALVRPDMLGRVLAVDYGLALLFEASSAVCVGWFLDEIGLTTMQVCIILGCVAVIFFFIWWLFSIYGGDQTIKTPIDSEEDQRDSLKKHSEINLDS